MLANLNYACSQFSHNFWSSYEYLIFYHSEDSFLLNDHIGYMLTIELTMVSKVQLGCLITFNIMSNICVCFR